MSARIKVLHVVGARPNLIKIAPIMRALQDYPAIAQILVHTGQHYDYNLSEMFFGELGIPQPDIHLNIGSDTQARQVAKIMMAFEEVCLEARPDIVLVVGDVNSTMACALVAAKLGIALVHVEAGIRSFDRSMPEEINRMVTDAVADYFLVPSADAVENLIREGHKPENVILVGNIMIDTLMDASERVEASEILDLLGLQKRSYAVMTLHRPSNVDLSEHLAPIIQAMQHIQAQMPLVFPMHPRTAEVMRHSGLAQKLAEMQNLIVCEPLGYFDFGRLLRDAAVVLTDSGGIQEETTMYEVPCITLRNNTERPITLTVGSNELAGNDPHKIVSLFTLALAGQWKKGGIPEFWDGRTAHRIAEFLDQFARKHPVR